MAVDARFTGAINSTILQETLMEVTVAGTNISYSDSMIVTAKSSLSVNATTEVKYDALVGIHTDTVIAVEHHSSFEASVAVAMAAQLGKYVKY